MEKFRQFTDRGSGISPFLPISSEPSSLVGMSFRTFLFLFRLPIFLFALALYFTVSSIVPLPSVARKLGLWTLMAIPGIWWVDLRIDGVRRGSLSQQPPDRVPHPRSVIAANFTSPIDAIYLSAVFDPIFVQSYPGTRKVRRISPFYAAWLALAPPQLRPPRPDGGSRLVTLAALLERHPDRVVAVFPECTATNGRGVLPFSPSLLAVPGDVKIFAVGLRYDPPDVTTPVPGAWLGFLWNLLSRPTHCIRVRISEGMLNTAAVKEHEMAVNGNGKGEVGVDAGDAELTPEEKKVLDRVAEALARLGRNRRVALTLQDKVAFAEAWNKGKR